MTRVLMRSKWIVLAVGILVAVAATFSFATAPDMSVEFASHQQDSETVSRGRYLVVAGACGSCHTPRDDPQRHLGGGLALNSPFGTFHVPNITPDSETGIGNWSDEDFVRAMRNGVSPQGTHYYPTFPYRWYRNMSDVDLIAMKAYLDTVTPIRNETAGHELRFPFSVRRLVGLWKIANLPGRTPAMENPSPSERRGEYLVTALGHCGACHTPTIPFIGVFLPWGFLAGNPDAFGAYSTANITPDPKHGIGSWSDADLDRVFRDGIRPDGFPVRGTMSEYVADSSSRLADGDIQAVIDYLRAIPEESNFVERTVRAERAGVFGEESLAFSVDPLGDPNLGRDIAIDSGPNSCVNCHATKERRDLSTIGNDIPGFPVLRGQTTQYLQNRLNTYANGTTYNPVMSPIATELSDEERAAVSDFYAVQPAPFSERGEAAEFNKPRDNAISRRGRQIAQSGIPEAGIAACDTCHDAGGTGFVLRYPYIAGQPAEYTRAQFSFWRRGMRTGDPLDVMRRIAERMSGDDVNAVALYYESILRNPGNRHDESDHK